MKLYFRLGVVALFLLALGAFPTPAFACTAPVGGLPHFTVAEHVQASNIVVEGIVIKTEGQWYPEVATIQVYQYIKGDGMAIIQVRGYHPSSMCGTDVRVDTHAIFYIRVDDHGSYYVMQLSQFDGLIEASQENLAEAIAASGQAPIVVSQPTVDAYLTVLATVTPATSTPTLTPAPYITVTEGATMATDTFVPITPINTYTPLPVETFTPPPPTETAVPVPTPEPVASNPLCIPFGFLLPLALMVWRKRRIIR